MKLTERCKEGFYKYLIENYPVNESDVNKWFLTLYVEFQNTLIIDFFDSVGLYIDTDLASIDGVFTANLFHEKHRTKTGRTISSIRDFKSRPEATTEAIKKANEIYNQNK